MYLRLKGAGIFYKVLNTPERIDVIEKMGTWTGKTPTSCARRPPSTAPWITASASRRATRKGSLPTSPRNSRCSLAGEALDAAASAASSASMPR